MKSLRREDAQVEGKEGDLRQRFSCHIKDFGDVKKLRTAWGSVASVVPGNTLDVPLAAS